jgi:hypothetical protein
MILNLSTHQNIINRNEKVTRRGRKKKKKKKGKKKKKEKKTNPPFHISFSSLPTTKRRHTHRSGHSVE